MFKDSKDTKEGQLNLARFQFPTIGIVTDNVCPKSEFQDDYRVKVKFPTLPPGTNGEESSWWCRVGTFGASKGGMGMFILPEKDDEVLVVFVNGDFNQGVIIATLWNGVDKPAFSNTEGKSATGRFQGDDPKFVGSPEAKKNDIRSFSTRAGHELIFNDNKTNPSITLSSGKKHRLVLSDKGGEATQIEIYDGKEENYVLIDTKNKKITLETKTGDILIKAKEKIRLEAKNIETESSQATKMKAGTNFENQASANTKIQASGTMDIKSGGAMTIKGSIININ